MIEINLVPGKKKKAAGAGFKFALPDFKAIIAQVKDPWLLSAIGAWAVAIAVGGGLFVYDRARLGRGPHRCRDRLALSHRADLRGATARVAARHVRGVRDGPA